MYHIDETTVDGLWGKVTPALERALSKTALGLTWDIPSAYQRIKEGRLFGFYQPESGYCGLYSVNETPLCKVIYWFWSGKLPENKEVNDPEEVTEYLTNAAKVFGCKYISAEGRPGFKHYAKSQGFLSDSTNWLKGVLI